MKLTLEEMKCEAVKRLEILNSLQPIEDLVINEFKEKRFCCLFRDKLF